MGRLLSGQSADGSWSGDYLATVGRLFGLHLTVRQSRPAIERALDWLAGRALGSGPSPAARLNPGRLAGLPFAPGGGRIFSLTACLFLASLFGRADEPGVLAGYRKLEELICSGKRLSWGSVNNLLRALVVHPEYASSRACQSLVDLLAGSQAASGGWPRPAPFYQLLNALAHLDSAAAGRQLEPALRRLVRTQRPDGTWSLSQPEWNTFLAVHALKNQNLL